MFNLSEAIASEQPGWSQTIWTSILLISAVVGFISNAIVIWIVITDNKMRTATNIYIANLAVADGLATAICAPLMSFRVVYGDWPFGYKLCRFNEFFDALNVIVSVLSLAMIAITQYQAIMDSTLQKRIGNMKRAITICFIWVAGGSITAPHWLPVSTFKYYTLDRGEQSVCIQIWPDYNINFIYRMTCMSLTYCFPLISISYSYCKIGVRVWLNKEEWADNTESKISQKQNVKKIVIGMILVVVGFSISWFPIHMVLILRSYEVKTPIGEFGYTASFALIIVHSMYNPIVYYCISKRWRAGFKRALKCCKF